MPKPYKPAWLVANCFIVLGTKEFKSNFIHWCLLLFYSLVFVVIGSVRPGDSQSVLSSRETISYTIMQLHIADKSTTEI